MGSRHFTAILAVVLAVILGAPAAFAQGNPEAECGEGVDSVKFNFPEDFSGDPPTATGDGVTATLSGGPNEDGEYTTVTWTSTTSVSEAIVKSGTNRFSGGSGTSGSGSTSGQGISHLTFCFGASGGGGDEPCVDDTGTPEDECDEGTGGGDEPCVDDTGTPEDECDEGTGGGDGDDADEGDDVLDDDVLGERFDRDPTAGDGGAEADVLGTRAGSEDDVAGSALPFTGAALIPIAVVGIGLIGCGATLYRRRHR